MMKSELFCLPLRNRLFICIELFETLQFFFNVRTVDVDSACFLIS